MAGSTRIPWPSDGPSRAEPPGPIQGLTKLRRAAWPKPHARPRLMVLEACANSSGLDFGMPVDLWRSGKTTVFLNSGSPPAQRPCTGPEYPFKETRFDLLLGGE